jgi:hypothetical protein
LNTLIYILFGLLFTFTSYFLVDLALISLLFWIKKVKIVLLQNILISVSLAGVGLAAMLLGMIAFSSLNLYLFATLLVVFSTVIYFGLLSNYWKISKFDAALVSITLAIILNPAWLHLVGIV